MVLATIDCISGDLGFFDEIHSGGYPTFEWLATDFAQFDRETSGKTLDNQENMKDMKKLVNISLI